MSDKLTEKQKQFCYEYLVDYNGTKAATRSGYSEKTACSQANRLLRNVEVLACVRKLQEEKTQRLIVTPAWVVQKLVDVTEKAMQAVPVMQYDYEEKELLPTGEYEFDSRGATKALELIGKHLGMFVEKIETKQTVTVVSKLDSILDELKDTEDETISEV